MVKTCILCKKESTFLNAGRSFHKFPRDQQLKHDWMHATDLTVVTKTAVICSDHFDETAFRYTGGHRTRKRLLLNAVPQKQTQSATAQSVTHTESISNAVPEKQTQSVSGRSIKNAENISNTVPEKQTQSTNGQSVRSAENMSNAVPQKQTQSANVQSVRDAENMIAESSNPESGNILASTSSHHCSDDKTAVTADSMKRNRSVVNEQRAKKVRFFTGFKTEYISRNDFISDEAWERFMRFNTYKTLKLRAANSRNFRKENKISIIAALVNDL